MGALADCSAETQFPSECRTAAQAAPFVNQAFRDFNIVTNGEKAALLMLFESGGLAFDINHTRWTPRAWPQAQALAGVNVNNPAAIPADTENAIRALVLTDQLSFASAMWFYTQSGPNKTGCTATAGMVAGLQAATSPGWEHYITNCVGTTVTPQRQAVYEKTLSVLLAKTAGI
ncbi:hypothetical protein C8R47DRAFT_966835 [Mycena vitilis]|nr:hypothetical protein C8R47DRAFT_966835 [Mycena vitilis]